jgi:ATP-binding protein involved in chromosome partitioning
MLRKKITADDVLRVLDTITDQGRGIVASGMVSGISIEGGKVSFVITIGDGEQQEKSWLQEACENAVRSLGGVKSVTAVLTAQTQGSSTEAANSNVPPFRKAVWNRMPLEYVASVIAVSSGKGGVGKSTTAVNLAHALARLGKRVGVLDADIYGPSLPRMMGISGKPEVKEDKIIPLTAHGIRCMSMGLLIGEESAIVWRGPQATKALQQMLRGVCWGTKENPLDILIIDMPPGTGDVHLSLVQQAPVDGAVLVTTPQEIAVIDAKKSADMFRKVDVPVVGVIENMSGFTDPATGKMHAIFGEGGGMSLAEFAKAPLLGTVPIDMRLREASDQGIRYADAAHYYDSIAQSLLENIR